jgi:hypothetical protein
MPVNSHTYQQAQQQLETLKEKQPQVRSIADLYQALWEIQEKVYASFTPDTSHIDRARGREKNAHQFPFLSKDDLLIEWEEFDFLLEDLVSVIQDRARSARTQVSNGT